MHTAYQFEFDKRGQLITLNVGRFPTMDALERHNTGDAFPKSTDLKAFASLEIPAHSAAEIPRAFPLDRAASQYALDPICFAT